MEKIDYLSAIYMREDAEKEGVSIENQVRKRYSWMHKNELNELIKEFKRVLADLGKEEEEIKQFLEKGNANNKVDDKEFAIKMIKKTQDPYLILKYCSPRLLDDKEIALAALNKDGFLFKYFSDRIKSDAEIQIVSLNNGGRIRLSECQDVVRDDYNAALASLKWCVEKEYSNLSERLKNDRDFNYNLVSGNIAAYSYIKNDFRLDNNFVSLVVNRIVPYDALRMLPYKALENKETMITIIKKYANPYEVQSFIPESLKGDRDVIMALILSDKCGVYPDHISCASQELKDDADFIFDIFVKYCGDEVDKRNIKRFLNKITNNGVNNNKTIKDVLVKIIKFYEDKSVDATDLLDLSKNNDYTDYKSIDEMIAASNGEINEYQLKVCKLLVDAIGIDKFVEHGTYREQFGFKVSDYNNVVRSIYTLAGELIKLDEPTRLLLYDYGKRDPEYEEFRRNLANMTGKNINCFTSRLERDIEERQYFSTSNLTPEVMKMMTRKPVVYIGKDKSYYQIDIADSNSYIKEVENTINRSHS